MADTVIFFLIRILFKFPMPRWMKHVQNLYVRTYHVHLYIITSYFLESRRNQQLFSLFYYVITMGNFEPGYIVFVFKIRLSENI